MMSAHYPTDKGVAARVEELSAGTDRTGEVDESMVYIWKDIPILRVAPERTDTGVMWRMFTRDEGEPLQ